MNFKNVKRWVTIAFHYLFWSMKGAEDVISGQNTDSNGSSYSQKGGNGGVFQDLINEEHTQQVKEVRDEYYRVLREADRYKVELVLDSDGNVSGGKARKKTKSDFVQHCEVDESDGLKIKLIQDNKHILKGSNFGFDINDINKGNLDYETTIEITRNGFIPRIEIEKFATKIVVKTLDNTTDVLDIYIPAMASQFGKLDAILISNLTRLMEEKNYKNDILDLDTLKFYTDKPWGVENNLLYEYNNLVAKDIFVYDGKFVIKYEAHIITDGEYIGKKYEMEEVTEKYDNQVSKTEAVNIFALKRKIEKENNLENNLFND